MPHAGTTEEAAQAADREFTSLLARLDIAMPPDLAPGVLAGHRSLRAMAQLLRDLDLESADV
ncbi:hypothetical protein [Kitasatospora sp. NPDC097643]|uniref:hypothetical protein n=1 Tax=Kitasatospora sp. NPDC097643 TaxID=3157230 RepID=UPI00331C2744